MAGDAGEMPSRDASGRHTPGLMTQRVLCLPQTPPSAFFSCTFPPTVPFSALAQSLHRVEAVTTDVNFAWC